MGPPPPGATVPSAAIAPGRACAPSNRFITRHYLPPTRFAFGVGTLYTIEAQAVGCVSAVDRLLPMLNPLYWLNRCICPLPQPMCCLAAPVLQVRVSVMAATHSKWSESWFPIAMGSVLFLLFFVIWLHKYLAFNKYVLKIKEVDVILSPPPPIAAD